MNLLPTRLLKPHPQNSEYYNDLAGEKYEEVKCSIETHGIRDPLKVTPDYTVIAGHQRLRIAAELGIEKVPVVIVDVRQEEALYLLIADNEERRQGDDDPMKKAKRAKFLKEYWRVSRGGDRKSKGQNVTLKTIEDIAQNIGEDERTTKRLLKLNDLILPLQELVSSGKLNKTAAEQLSYLSPENQQIILDTVGEGIGEKSVTEAKEIRKRLETAEKTAVKAQAQAEAERQRAAQAEKSLQEIQQREPEVVVKEKVVEKVVEIQPPDYTTLKKRVREQEEELIKKTDALFSLTQEQMKIKDQHVIRDLLVRIVQELGRGMKKAELEVIKMNYDMSVCQEVKSCVEVLKNAAAEMESWIYKKSEVIIDGDYTISGQPNSN